MSERYKCSLEEGNISEELWTIASTSIDRSQRKNKEEGCSKYPKYSNKVHQKKSYLQLPSIYDSYCLSQRIASSKSASTTRKQIELQATLQKLNGFSMESIDSMNKSINSNTKMKYQQQEANSFTEDFDAKGITKAFQSLTLKSKVKNQQDKCLPFIEKSKDQNETQRKEIENDDCYKEQLSQQINEDNNQSQSSSQYKDDLEEYYEEDFQSNPDIKYDEFEGYHEEKEQEKTFCDQERLDMEIQNYHSTKGEYVIDIISEENSYCHNEKSQICSFKSFSGLHCYSPLKMSSLSNHCDPNTKTYQNNHNSEEDQYLNEIELNRIQIKRDPAKERSHLCLDEFKEKQDSFTEQLHSNFSNINLPEERKNNLLKSKQQSQVSQQSSTPKQISRKLHTSFDLPVQNGVLKKQNNSSLSPNILKQGGRQYKSKANKRSIDSVISQSSKSSIAKSSQIKSHSQKSQVCIPRESQSHNKQFTLKSQSSPKCNQICNEQLDILIKNTCSIVNQIKGIIGEKEYEKEDIEGILEENKQLNIKLDMIKREIERFKSDESIEQKSISITLPDSQQKKSIQLPKQSKDDIKTLKNKEEIFHLKQTLHRLKDRAKVVSEPSYLSSIQQQAASAQQILSKLKIQMKQEEGKRKEIEKKNVEFQKQNGIKQEEREIQDLKIKIEEIEKKIDLLKSTRDKNIRLIARTFNELQIKEEILKEATERTTRLSIQYSKYDLKSNTKSKIDQMNKLKEIYCSIQESNVSTENYMKISEEQLKNEVTELKKNLIEVQDQEIVIDHSMNSVTTKIKKMMEEAFINDYFYEDLDEEGGKEEVEEKELYQSDLFALKEQNSIEKDNLNYQSIQEDDSSLKTMYQECHSQIKSDKPELNSFIKVKGKILDKATKEQQPQISKQIEVIKCDYLNKNGKIEEQIIYETNEEEQLTLSNNEKEMIQVNFKQEQEELSSAQKMFMKPTNQNYSFDQPFSVESKSMQQDYFMTQITELNTLSSAPINRQNQNKQISIDSSDKQNESEQSPLNIEKTLSQTKNQTRLFNFSKRNRQQSHSPFLPNQESNDKNKYENCIQGSLKQSNQQEIVNPQANNFLNEIKISEKKNDYKNALFLVPNQRIARKKNNSYKQINVSNQEYEPTFVVKEITEKIEVKNENNSETFEKIFKSEDVFSPNTQQTQLHSLLNHKDTNKKYDNDDEENQIFGHSFLGKSRKFKIPSKKPSEKTRELAIQAGNRDLFVELDIS